MHCSDAAYFTPITAAFSTTTPANINFTMANQTAFDVGVNVPPPPPPPQSTQSTTSQMPFGQTGIMMIPPVQGISSPNPLPLTAIPTPQELDLAAIPEPMMNIELIQMPEHGEDGNSVEG